MRLRFRHPVDFVTAGIILWCVFYLIINFLVPDKYILDYQELSVAETACRDTDQTFYGKRDAFFTMEAKGVDQLWSVEQERYVDRFEWKGRYFGGETESSWKNPITALPGTYYWEATTLRVQLPLFISVYIEDVRSNTFEVILCE